MTLAPSLNWGTSCYALTSDTGAGFKQEPWPAAFSSLVAHPVPCPTWGLLWSLTLTLVKDLPPSATLRLPPKSILPDRYSTHQDQDTPEYLTYLNAREKLKSSRDKTRVGACLILCRT